MSNNEVPREVVDFFRGVMGESKKLDSFITSGQKNVRQISNNVKSVFERDIKFIQQKNQFTNEDRQATMNTLFDPKAAVVPKNVRDLTSVQNIAKIDLGTGAPSPEVRISPGDVSTTRIQNEQHYQAPTPPPPEPKRDRDDDNQMELSFEKITIGQVYDILEAIFNRIERLEKAIESLK